MLNVGKLDSQLLQEIVFKNIQFKRPEVIVRPGIGEDCAVVDFGAYQCVMSTDPITAAINQIGRLAVHISCNDIASNGVEPLGIMLAVMLPEGTTETEIEEIMRQAGKAASELGVEIIGGHTEITSAVNKPVIVSTAIGRSLKGASEMEPMMPGDFILMTKWAGLEGTGIAVSDYEEALTDVLCMEEINEAKGLLDLVSVVKEGVIAGEIGVTGMHDVTEGGILGAVWELCHVAKLGAEVWADDIPVLPVTEKICEKFNIDFLRLISSGCMAMTVRPEKRCELERRLHEAGIKATCIGIVQAETDGIQMIASGKKLAVAPPSEDELYKIVSQRNERSSRYDIS